MCIRDFFKGKETQEQFIRKTLNKFVSNETLEELLERDRQGEDVTQPRRITLHFALTRVRDTDISGVPKTLAEIFRISAAHNAIVTNMAGSMVLTSLSTESQMHAGNKMSRALFVAELIGHCGQNLAVVHGARVSLIGNVLSADQLGVGAVIPDFGKLLQQLLSLPWGGVQEI